jgi:tetratricopeptide (TPR) repeat protein
MGNVTINDVQTLNNDDNLEISSQEKEIINRNNVTIAHTCLSLEAFCNLPINNAHFTKLDNLFSLVSKHIKSRKTFDPEIILNSIHLSISEAGYSIYTEGPELTFLAEAIDKNILDCKSASILYVAIGEQNNLPIYMVRCPQHTFVRWRISPSEYINWETVGYPKPFSCSNNHYIKGFQASKTIRFCKPLHKRIINEGIYLSDLQRHQIISLFYFMHGLTFSKKLNDQNRSIEEYKKGISLDRKYPDNYYNLSVVLNDEKRFTESITYISNAIQINPYDLDMHINLATTAQIDNQYGIAFSTLFRSLIHFPLSLRVLWVLFLVIFIYPVDKLGKLLGNNSKLADS